MCKKNVYTNSKMYTKIVNRNATHETSRRVQAILTEMCEDDTASKSTQDTGIRQCQQNWQCGRQNVNG